MHSLVRTGFWTPLILLLVGCATFSSNEHETAPYYEASFDDKNRIHSIKTPNSLIDQNGTSKVDPLYMRTQADYYFAKGEAYSFEGNSNKAIEAFNSTLLYDTDSPIINMRLAGEYLKQGMISEAIEHAEMAEKKDPKNVDALILLGGLYSYLKLYPKAMEKYEIVLKLNPANAEAPLYLGALYSEQNQPEKAVKYFESLLNNTSYTTPHLVHYYVGRIRMEQKNPKYKKAAEESLKKSIQIVPDFVDAVISLATLYKKQGQEEKALNLYRSFQKQNNPSPKIAEMLVQIFLEQDRLDLAYEQLNILDIKEEPSLSVKMKMALILIEQKKYPDSILKLEEILTFEPDSDKARFYLAAVYEEMGKNEFAVKEFKKIPSASKYFGDSIAHAAFLLKGMEKSSEAIELVSKALEARKDQAQFYSVYASLLEEKTDYVGAANTLQKGLELFPDNLQLRFFFGAVNDRLGNKDIVIREMNKILEADPNHAQGLNYLAFTYAELNTNLNDAENLARRASELEPEDGYILDTLGLILYKKNKLSEAVKTLEAAYRQKGTVSIIAEHLGDVYYKLSMVDKAKKMYIRAADLEKNKLKQDEIRNKITAIEQQELNPRRLPATIQLPLINSSSR